jgi:hypothetical protein
MIAEASRPLARREEGTYRKYVIDEQCCQRVRGPAKAFRTFQTEN